MVCPSSRQLLHNPNRVAFLTNNRALNLAGEGWREGGKGWGLGCVALLLADERVDPSPEDNEAIQLALRNSHHACVSLLWADPRVRERRVTRALQKAIENSLAHSSV